MKYALTINQETRRILSATFAKYADKNAILCDTLPTGETEDEKNIHNWRINENGEYIYDPIIPEVSVEAQIAELKAQLEATDYKVIKCSEAQLAGVDMPYDVAELHAERQALRDKINELEGGGE